MSGLKTCLTPLWVLLLLCLLPQLSCAFWGQSYLLQINGEEYTEQDYRHWWKEWQEPGMAVHESLDPYIDFLLLSGEADAMQLFENPGYKKKLDVFLKVRSLMQLKAEEVDAKKVIPPQEELWQTYQEEYTPLLDLRMIAVQDDNQSAQLQELIAQGVAFEKLVETAGLEGKAEQFESTGLMRFTRIPEVLRAAVLPLQQGDVAGPVKYGHVWYFLEVLQRQDGNEEDFAGLKQKLIRNSLKQQELDLTAQLLDQLKKEYAVQINQSLIDTITVDGVPSADADKIAITIEDLKIPASFVYASIEKGQKLRGTARRNAESFEATKKRVVNDILVQVLTEKAALDRNYEEVPPLKPVYDFYRQYRLLKEFERVVVQPEVQVTDADIENYYNENGEQFSDQGMIEYAQVTTNEEALAEDIAEKLKNGAEFFSVMEPISPSGVQVKKEPLVHLKPVVQEAVKSLASGQVTVIPDGANTHFIKVVRAVETKVMPLEHVREMIRKTLEKQHFKAVRDDFVRRLRERSTIKLNNGKWQTLRKELLEEKAS
ncbi:PPIC-type PPIASE domain-containing protein [Malonomonas rubra DSM 5091]|uniref:peptidylprolyl isomerase n=1 Tax=Malonomonas rubra DSM 5091 TaxID=1122189 RepID=A0A1M6BZE2_MALRU|nr:peptidyl-prolyl cis-trans isomerase [Malonomonas rubra]SHI54097.1 PPIC-type PPIASE domain-containing protein [Malonomonas rubra DSM 5091]